MISSKGKLAIGLLALVLPGFAGLRASETQVFAAFCLFGEPMQIERISWEWPHHTDPHSRQQLLRDVISCTCTQRFAPSTECVSEYPIPPGTDTETLEDWARGISVLGSLEEDNQCMLKKGYAPVIHKVTVCHWHVV